MIKLHKRCDEMIKKIARQKQKYKIEFYYCYEWGLRGQNEAIILKGHA